MKIIADYFTGADVYAIIFNDNGQVWNDDDSAFQTLTDADWNEYAVPLTEQGTASGFYTATFPTAIASGEYTVYTLHQAGTAVAVTDLKLRAGAIAV